MDKVIGKNAIRIVGVVILLVSLTVAMSSYYYRAIELNPMAVLHGANMAARSLFSSRSNLASIDLEALERVHERAAKWRSEFPEAELIDLSKTTKSERDVQNLLAANKSREIQLGRDQSELENIRQRLLNSRATLVALGKDYTDIISLNDIQAGRLADIGVALESSHDVPSEVDLQTLLQKQVGANSIGKGIPQSVLENAEKAIGISPDEINELMNK